MIYGAYGYTGKLLVEQAIARGERPVLAGRDPESLEEVASKHHLSSRTFALDDIEIIKENLEGISLVLNAAGPFVHTADIFIQACLGTMTHYLDITGEIQIFEHNQRYNSAAEESQIAIISGVGFDVVPSDCLALYTSKKIKNPVSLEIGINAISTYSPGTMKTTIENIQTSSVIRENGKIKPTKLGKNCKEIRFTHGSRRLCTIAWGDIATAYRSTGIPNIKVYMGIPRKLGRLVRTFGFLIRPLFKMNWVQDFAKKWIDKHVKGPDKEMRETSRSYLWCRVENAQGFNTRYSRAYV